jgi:hypothetical protein
MLLKLYVLSEEAKSQSITLRWIYLLEAVNSGLPTSFPGTGSRAPSAEGTLAETRVVGWFWSLNQIPNVL